MGWIFSSCFSPLKYRYVTPQAELLEYRYWLGGEGTYTCRLAHLGQDRVFCYKGTRDNYQNVRISAIPPAAPFASIIPWKWTTTEGVCVGVCVCVCVCAILVITSMSAHRIVGLLQHCIYQ